MRAHDDEVRFRRRGRPQDAVEGIAGDDHWTASNAAQFGHCADLLAEDPFGLTRLDRDQVLRLIVVHDVDESEFRVRALRQQAGSPQRSLRPGREVRRC